MSAPKSAAKALQGVKKARLGSESDEICTNCA